MTAVFKQLNTIHTIKRTAEYNNSHYFDRDTMRYFNSRLSERVYTVKDHGAYFVTSERQSWSHPRLYTVRYMTLDGDIDTVGEFQAYGTGEAAHKAAKDFASKGAPNG